MSLLVDGLDFKVAHTSGPSAAFLDIRFAQSSEASLSGLECDLSSITRSNLPCLGVLKADVPETGLWGDV